MSEKPTRRGVLRTTATAGAAATFVPQTVRGDPPTVRTVEAGIRYDIDIQDDYSVSHLDSRPLFTVDRGRGEVALANRVSQSREAAMIKAQAFIDEQPLGMGQSKTITPGNESVRSIPTDLSARMRPTRVVNLAADHRLPRVLVQPNGARSKVVLPPGETRAIQSETEQQIHLEPETVEVETVTFTDEKVPVEGRPEDRWGPAREYGSVEVQATPVVEIVDHGELVVSRRKFP